MFDRCVNTTSAVTATPNAMSGVCGSKPLAATKKRNGGGGDHRPEAHESEQHHDQEPHDEHRQQQDRLQPEYDPDERRHPLPPRKPNQIG